jgi:hypothetical protein
MKALLAAKRSPVRWGSQMCLNVGGFSFFFSVFLQQIIIVVVFSACP